MKTIITIILLLISSIGIAQEVDVFDENRKKVFEKPVQLKDVGELLKEYKGKTIYVQYWDGKHVQECEYSRFRNHFNIEA